MKASTNKLTEAPKMSETTNDLPKRCGRNWTLINQRFWRGLCTKKSPRRPTAPTPPARLPSVRS